MLPLPSLVILKTKAQRETDAGWRLSHVTVTESDWAPGLPGNEAAVGFHRIEGEGALGSKELLEALRGLPLPVLLRSLVFILRVTESSRRTLKQRLLLLNKDRLGS